MLFDPEMVLIDVQVEVQLVEEFLIQLILGILSGQQYSCYLGKVLSVALFRCAVTLASGEAMVSCMFVFLSEWWYHYT